MFVYSSNVWVLPQFKALPLVLRGRQNKWRPWDVYNLVWEIQKHAHPRGPVSSARVPGGACSLAWPWYHRRGSLLGISQSLIPRPNHHASSTHLGLGWVLSTNGLITAARLPPAPTSTAVLDSSTAHCAIRPTAFQPHPNHTIAFSSRTVLLPPFTPQHSTLDRCHSVAPPCQACWHFCSLVSLDFSKSVSLVLASLLSQIWAWIKL